jgi:predicted DNA-binding transcriptional regulator AlpA
MTGLRRRFDIPPRGLNRVQSADYVGLGVSKFDRLVADGRMPKPVRIDGRVIWDRHSLDAAFDALFDVDQDRNPWDIGTVA